MGFFAGISRGIALAALIAIAPPTHPRNLPPSAAPVPFSGRLSVMTYNIHGAPWPVAWDRPADFERMAATLRSLRARGKNPHIVVLQEAFTSQAQAMGRAAGYRYIADGADEDAGSGALPSSADLRFAARDSWIHGEGIGKYVGSGLQILSDYPIVHIRRMVFPAFACAGWDCLANKGALLARIRLPGQSGAVDVVTTHLNSRRASGVADERSNHAFTAELADLSAFIRHNHDPRNALIVAGDFNAGQTPERRAELMDRATRTWVPGVRIDNAYDAAQAGGIALTADALSSRQRARDWEFFAPGRTLNLKLRGIAIPFGHDAAGTMLSDHVGYTGIFDIRRSA
ncbi:endonuclease/exonuclease/phosphatase family protein [Sphingobium estronivorans]|uniref:endonuclease/exonuclease/phosphatase family protein n=1 Tax=Sphingobium estronivorans TaxID=1577690 RepID=UPI00123C4964|nr:endonuclease/exonuclease/phosphatase family protein [Sphingobium estronivorans]